MAASSVKLTGFPVYFSETSLCELASDINKILQSDDIGSFRVRYLGIERKKRANQRGTSAFAMDFESGFDAIEAQRLLDKHEFPLPNGECITLCARVDRDASKLPNTELPPAGLSADSDEGDEEQKNSMKKKKQKKEKKERSTSSAPDTRPHSLSGSPRESRVKHGERRSDSRESRSRRSSPPSRSPSRGQRSRSSTIIRENRRSRPRSSMSGRSSPSSRSTSQTRDSRRRSRSRSQRDPIYIIRENRRFRSRSSRSLHSSPKQTRIEAPLRWSWSPKLKSQWRSRSQSPCYDEPPIYKRIWPQTHMKSSKGTNRSIPENPRFIIPVRTLFRKVKKFVKAADLDETHKDRLIQLVKMRMSRRIQQILRNITIYLPSDLILPLYYEHFPLSTHRYLVEELVAHIKEKLSKTAIIKDEPQSQPATVEADDDDAGYVERRTLEEVAIIAAQVVEISDTEEDVRVKIEVKEEPREADKAAPEQLPAYTNGTNIKRELPDPGLVPDYQYQTTVKREIHSPYTITIVDDNDDPYTPSSEEPINVLGIKNDPDIPSSVEPSNVLSIKNDPDVPSSLEPSNVLGIKNSAEITETGPIGVSDIKDVKPQIKVEETIDSIEKYVRLVTNIHNLD